MKKTLKYRLASALFVLLWLIPSSGESMICNYGVDYCYIDGYYYTCSWFTIGYWGCCSQGTAHDCICYAQDCNYGVVYSVSCSPDLVARMCF